MKSTLTALALVALVGGGAALAQNTQVTPGGRVVTSTPPEVFAQNVPRGPDGAPTSASDFTKAMPAEIPAPRTASVDVLGAANKKLGTATLTEGKQGVLIRIALDAGALTPGWHGLHIHEKADCSAAGFTSAGGHIGHGANGAMHGLLNPMGPEPGDLPSLYAPASGPITAEVFSPWATLGMAALGARQPLLDADGSALVIHTNVDDQKTQPIGGAGDRVACAVIKG